MATSHNRAYPRMAKTIKQHYGLRSRVTSAEVLAEVAKLQRKHAKGTLDDSQELLYAALDLKPLPPPKE